MREKISFDKEWYFHRGEITYKEPLTKGFMYVSAKNGAGAYRAGKQGLPPVYGLL